MAYNPHAIPVPVAVPLQDGDDTFSTSVPARPCLATAQRKSNYNLPSSRRIGDQIVVPEEQIQQLMKQGYTRGLALSLAQTIRTYPLRIWVVDNSGSMQNTDGHRFVETKSSRDVKVVSCSRWDEIRDCITYHAQMAAALEAPTTFRMLNDPAVGPNSQQFGIAETSLDQNVIQGEVHRAVEIMKMAQPGGVTPLVEHILDIQQCVAELAPKLRADGCRVVIVLATDGLPTDDRGYGGSAIQQQFVQALRGLEGLPVWLVIRLCTDEEQVVNFYNELDGQLELSLEVLDDFLGEANEVHEHNPWLNYALPLHRLREMGYQHRSFDMMDERPFTHEELRDFCNLLFNDKFPSDELPDPSIDWKGFAKALESRLHKESVQWNPIKKKVGPWIDMKKLNKIYGNNTCTIM
ncbi:hypothetical protein HJC23_011291 [Cyclotella cryptica]|uniref:VWFA domain-containing protein n=1 Tax=Cyclotella cryptica TaxID=29204 RepID=A0ABD3QV95_9STRA|eukprot:CCRYP_001686-RA/>CCRYP_001686-RA protein AED:0.08 eAED:0.08 QI:154/1/1/1/0.66/0.5/4/411/406